MNKSALSKFAVNAREELISKVKIKAAYYGITEKGINEKTKLSNDGVFVGDIRLDKKEEHQWYTLKRHINDINTDNDYLKVYNSVIDEVAYTWFNRFSALRFMELHDYLPTGIRVISSKDGGADPEILTEALNINLDIDKEKVFKLKHSGETSDRNELYKYMVLKQCESLNEILPFLFDKTKDYVELLFPDNLLGETEFLGMMLTIDEDSWQDVEVIGWLYQYYISKRKDEVFANLKKNIKIEKEDIAPATQIFTPDWIVKYMVQNSLGKLCEEITQDYSLKENWKYYIESAVQDNEVSLKLKVITEENSKRSIEDIKVLDPSMGSGHILVYAFDLLYEVYLKQGYQPSEIPQIIIEKNLFGIDIDYRATQLAYFALMMKGREKYRRFFNKKVIHNLCAIEQSNEIINFEYNSGMENIDKDVVSVANYLIDIFHDAQEYGSILNVKNKDYDLLIEYLNKTIINVDNNLLQQSWINDIYDKMIKLANQAKLLSTKYDVMCTNPPYMGVKGMDAKLSIYIKDNYPDTKSDLFAVFMNLDEHLVKENGYCAMINQHSWMFLPRFEKYRMNIIANRYIESMLHLGPRVFEEISGEVVQSTSFVLRKTKKRNINGNYIRLIDYKSIKEKQLKMIEAIANKECGYFFNFNQSHFVKIPGSRIAYWANGNLILDFQNGIMMSEITNPKQGLATANNNRFIKQWFEVQNNDICFKCSNSEDALASKVKWFPYNKGGSRRQWYGNYDYVVNWEKDGYEIKHFYDSNGKQRSRPQNTNYYFKEAITWSLIGSGVFSIRYRKMGSIHDVGGMSAFAENELDLKYILGLMSTKIANYIFKMLNPTVNLQIGDFTNFPVVKSQGDNNEIINIVDSCINSSKLDWDQFELSWDFVVSPILKGNSIESAYVGYKNEVEERFLTIKNNETELNRIFIDIYGLQDELTPEVADRDITVARIYNTKKEITKSIKDNMYVLTKEDVVKQFISYAVGCMLGRYSLDVDGLAYAGGEFDYSKYKIFPVDVDNCIPITDERYFEDDIVTRFFEFVKVVYSEDSFEANIEFIARALNSNGEPREVIRNYFIKDFYKDHCKMYKKRPIYWLFDSGNDNGFKALIYMHRYDSSTLARVRTDYLHKQQGFLELHKNNLEGDLLFTDSLKEKKKIENEIVKKEKQLNEIKAYDEKLHHMADMRIDIDLDDGQVGNYAKFEGLLAEIK